MLIKKQYTIKAIKGDNSMVVKKAVEYCGKNKIDKLVLEKGEYHFIPSLPLRQKTAACQIMGTTDLDAQRSS